MHNEGKRHGKYCQLVAIVELFGQLVLGGVNSLSLKYNWSTAQAGDTGEHIQMEGG